MALNHQVKSAACRCRYLERYERQTRVSGTLVSGQRDPASGSINPGSRRGCCFNRHPPTPKNVDPEIILCWSNKPYSQNRINIIKIKTFDSLMGSDPAALQRKLSITYKRLAFTLKKGSPFWRYSCVLSFSRTMSVSTCAVS